MTTLARCPQCFKRMEGEPFVHICLAMPTQKKRGPKPKDPLAEKPAPKRRYL